MPLSHLCGSSRSSLRFYDYLCRRRLSCGRSRKVYVLVAVITVPSRSSRYICVFRGSLPQRTAPWTAYVRKGYLLLLHYFGKTWVVVAQTENNRACHKSVKLAFDCWLFAYVASVTLSTEAQRVVDCSVRSRYKYGSWWWLWWSVVEIYDEVRLLIRFGDAYSARTVAHMWSMWLVGVERAPANFACVRACVRARV